MDSTANLTLPYIAAAQAQKHVTHNEALRALDAIVQLTVLDKDLAAPPGSPADGARYIVASGASGAWAGEAGKVAAYQDGAWMFYPPREGWLAWVADDDELHVWSGSSWDLFAGGGGGGGLAAVADDTTPQLGGDLDANAHSIGFDDGTGIADDAGNEQLVFHKTAGAVNQLGITNAATSSPPGIAAEGDDTDIDLLLAGKGTGHPKAALFGVNATADTTTRFAIASAASLFSHAGSGHQHKINKNAAGDTASLLFQTNFSGRAEMGIAGDDDFHFKVSADGSTWMEAIVIDRTTGAASFPLTPRREILTASRTYYVRTDGSDANTGLVNSSGGAFLTVQKAVDVAASLDLGIYDVTITIGAGTYTSQVDLKSSVGAGTILLIGDETTPSNVLTSVTSGHCFRADFVRGAYALRGMKLQTTTSGLGIYNSGSFVTFQNLDFGAIAQQQLFSELGGTTRASGDYTISGSAANHYASASHGRVEVRFRTVTLSGTPAFAAFASAVRMGFTFAQGITFSGSATGTRYSVTTNALIETGGGGANFFPGNAAGADATGGVYN